MIPFMPAITEHAYQRAEDRLKIDRRGFAGWVGATWDQWMPVTSPWLALRGVTRCTDRDTSWYATPWTVDEGLAMALSPDHAIRTVIAFHQKASLKIEMKSEGLPAVISELIESARFIANEIGGPASLLGHRAQRTLELFVAGKLDLQDVRDIMAAPNASKDAIIAARIKLQRIAG